MTIALLNAICWFLFIGVWILGAVYNYYTAPTVRQTHFRYDSLVCAVVSCSCLFIFYRYLIDINFHVIWLQAIGTVMLIISTLFTIWSRWVLGKMWSNYAAVKEEHKLVTNGPYRISRHPIYSGLLGMILGSAISNGQGFVFLLFIIALLFLLNRIRKEEQLMAVNFGEQYAKYKNRVPLLILGFKFRTKRK